MAPFKKKNNHISEEDDNLWMLTYSDLVTLLFTFFVLLYSISSPDPMKIQLLSNYFSQENKMTFTELQQKIEEYIVDNKVEDQVAVKLTSKGVEISLKDKAIFDVGSAEIKEKATPILTEISSMLNYEEISDRKISVEGHTDSIPIKSELYPSNWELSSARSANVVRYFIANGLNYKRFESIGYADTRPLIEESGLNRGLPENRRVVVVISPESYISSLKRKELAIGKKSETVRKKEISNMVNRDKKELVVPVSGKNDINTSKSTSSGPENELIQKKRELFSRGQTEFQNGNYNEAIMLWKKVLEIDPGHTLSKKNIERAKSKLQ